MRPALPRVPSRQEPRATAGLDGLLGEVVRFRAGQRTRAAARATATVGGRLPAQHPAHAATAGAGRAAAIPAQGEPAVSAAGAPDGAPDGYDLPALLARVAAGDADAFGEIYDRNVDTVYRYVYYRVGSVAVAEDLVSETFLRALRRIDSFTYQGRDIAAWLLTIARNLLTDHYKSSRYRLELSTDDMVGTPGERPAGDDPEAAAIASMTSRVLVEAIKALNPEQQECVVLRFLQGLSVSETAEAMGKNDGAIKALQYRAVKALARRLPPESR